MLYFFHGDNAFGIREALQEAMARVVAQEGADAREVTKIHSDDADPERLYAALASQGLFARDSVVVAEQVTTFPKAFRDKLLVYLKEHSLAQAKAIHLFVTAPVSDEKSAKKSKPDSLVAYLAAHATEVQRVTMPSHIPQWIVERGKRYGLRFAPDAARLLAEAQVGDIARVAQEIEKLVLYRGGSPEHPQSVEAAHVTLLGSARVTQDAFMLFDAMGKGDSAGMVRVLLRLREFGEEPVRVLGLLAFGIRAMLAVQDAHARPVHPREFPAITGLPDWQIRSYGRYASRYTVADLRKLLDRLLSVDFKIKTGEGSPWMLLERFLFTAFSSVSMRTR